jgi:hypothetical protein
VLRLITDWDSGNWMLHAEAAERASAWNLGGQRVLDLKPLSLEQRLKDAIHWYFPGGKI